MTFHMVNMSRFFYRDVTDKTLLHYGVLQVMEIMRKVRDWSGKLLWQSNAPPCLGKGMHNMVRCVVGRVCVWHKVKVMFFQRG